MSRYHKKIYFPKKYIQQLNIFTRFGNHLKWKYTAHCINNIKNRAYDLKEVLEFIKNIILYPEQIFEFYTDIGFITKICYRIPYNKDIDLILVVGVGKKLITVYYNDRGDKHFTLKQEVYTKGGK